MTVSHTGLHHFKIREADNGDEEAGGEADEEKDEENTIALIGYRKIGV